MPDLLFSATLLRPGNSPLVLTKQARVLQYSTVMPGGFGSCTLELPGDFKRWAKEIPYRSTLQVCQGDKVIFEGRVEDRSMAFSASGVTTQVALFGLSRRLSDTSVVRTWLQRDIGWQLVVGSSSDITTTVGQVDSSDLTRIGVRFSNDTGAAFPAYSLGSSVNYQSPTSLVRIMGAISAPVGLLGGKISWVSGYQLFSGPLSRSAFDVAVTSGNITLEADFKGSEPAGTAIIFENLRLLGTSLTEDVSGGMYGGKILADLVAQVTGISPGQIDTGSDYALPSCAADTRRMVSDIVTEICSYYTREWAVWEGGRFDWKQPVLDQVQYFCQVADLQPGSQITATVDDCYSRIFVLYTNAGSADNGFPGEQPALATEPRNPFVNSGETRDLLLSPDTVMTDASALQLAQKVLSDYGKFPGVRGQIVLKARQGIDHATLGTLPAYLIRAGDNITVTDLPKTDILVEGRDGETQYHVTASDVDLIANTVTLQIEGQAVRADALLARLATATKQLGG